MLLYIASSLVCSTHNNNNNNNNININDDDTTSFSRVAPSRNDDLGCVHTKE